MRREKEIVYRCEYCNKPYISRSGCVRHEAYCYRNDDRKICVTCHYGNINGDKCNDFYRYEHKSIETQNDDWMIISCKGWKEKE